MLGDRDGQIGWPPKASRDVDRKNGAIIAAELAQLATEIGDYELALKPLRAITLMDNPQPPITRPMARLRRPDRARPRQPTAGRAAARSALREDPAFAEAQQFLDELA
ncbi:MAG: hypothetical protein HS111_33150 [Kofleriaceae bacterium]|nr:hypothetical protein [Kofleriaceae bacterium]